MLQLEESDPLLYSTAVKRFTPHAYPIDPILKVLRLVVWGKILLVWTYWGLGRHFYYGVGAL